MEPSASAQRPVSAFARRRKVRLWWRLITLALFLLAIGLTIWFFKFNPLGQRLLKDRPYVRDLIWRHPWKATFGFILTYIVLAAMAMPIWPLQVIAGFCFTVEMGVAYCETGSALGGVAAMLVARWLLRDFFRQRVEARLEKLRRLEQRLDNNGLFVVMCTRLLHFLPFGASNYVFGLTTITPLQVLAGTLVGNLPAIVLYVGLGAGFHHWKFFMAVVGLNLALALPLLWWTIHCWRRRRRG